MGHVEDVSAKTNSSFTDVEANAETSGGNGEEAAGAVRGFAYLRCPTVKEQFEQSRSQIKPNGQRYDTSISRLSIVCASFRFIRMPAWLSYDVVCNVF